MVCDDLLSYPDFNEEFKVHADSRIFQLGAVISQKGKTITFYSSNLTYAHKMYTATEKELLSIIETLKSIRTILLDQKLGIHTYNKKITYNKFNRY